MAQGRSEDLFRGQPSLYGGKTCLQDPSDLLHHACHHCGSQVGSLIPRLVRRMGLAGLRLTFLLSKGGSRIGGSRGSRRGSRPILSAVGSQLTANVDKFRPYQLELLPEAVIFPLEEDDLPGAGPHAMFSAAFRMEEEAAFSALT